jgi:hypothetical protein
MLSVTVRAFAQPFTGADAAALGAGVDGLSLAIGHDWMKPQFAPGQLTKTCHHQPVGYRIRLAGAPIAFSPCGSAGRVKQNVA